MYRLMTVVPEEQRPLYVYIIKQLIIKSFITELFFL